MVPLSCRPLRLNHRKYSKKDSDEDFISQSPEGLQDVGLSPNKTADISVVVSLPTGLSEKDSTVEINGLGLKSTIAIQVTKFTVHIHDTQDKSHPVKYCVSAKLKSLVDKSVLKAKVVSKAFPIYA